MKTFIGERILLTVEYAKDRSIYYSHGYKSTKSTVYGGEHTIDGKIVSREIHFREQKVKDLPENFKGSHTGIKNSGIVLNKWDYEDDKQYFRSVITSEEAVTKPILIEQVFPGKFEKYLERKSERKRDFIFPTSEGTIEQSTNFKGFRFEIWLRESHISSDLMLYTKGIINGIDIRLGTKILSLLLIQDSNDISRGPMDNMLILRAKTLNEH